MLAGDNPTQPGSLSGSLNGRSQKEQDRESRMQTFLSTIIRESKEGQQAPVVETSAVEVQGGKMNHSCEIQNNIPLF